MLNKGHELHWIQELIAPCAVPGDLWVADVTPKTLGCTECLRTGKEWTRLRICMSCGHVGCCDDSPNRHATTHFRATLHPIILSCETGEFWWYCYIDDLAVLVDAAPPFARTAEGGRET